LANQHFSNNLLTTIIVVSFCLLSQTGCRFPVESPQKVQKYFSDTNQEVTVYSIKGENKGPTLLIIAGIHGDESSCPMVADRYTNIKIKKGNLIVVPRLNLPAITAQRRNGLGGDMNRLFDMPERSQNNPDLKVVNLAKSLIKNADYVLNLHQGSGFYSPTWISHKRNPKRWGQCNVIDTPSFDLPNGEKLELENFAQRLARRINSKIKDENYHFLVNNTNTASENTIHKEQRKSLTYYALINQHKVALGLEVTKNCPYSQAVAFLTIAINSTIEETGIIPEEVPSETVGSKQ